MKICPVCEQLIGEGVPIYWSLALNSQAFTLKLDVCRVDQVLCNMFPTLKRALLQSEVATEMMRRAGVQ